jgi:hypothetical protein
MLRALLAAIRLYTSCGFRFTGDRQPFPSDPSLTERAMELPLGRS